jgi:hypothetical protein
MFGRDSLGGLVGMTILALILASSAPFGETVRKTYKIKGFTCAGCAPVWRPR